MPGEDTNATGVDGAGGRHERSINIDRLTHTVPKIPLLIGYKNNQWVGISVQQWIVNVETYFNEENITDDRGKLRSYSRFINHEQGNISLLINHTPDLLNASTWDSFKENLCYLIDPLSSISFFDSFNNLFNVEWSPNVSLPEFITSAQKEVQEFIDATVNQFGISFSPEQRKLFLFGLLYRNVKSNFHKIINENFEIENSIPKNIQVLLSKSRQLNNGKIASNLSNKVSDVKNAVPILSANSVEKAKFEVPKTKNVFHNVSKNVNNNNAYRKNFKSQNDAGRLFCFNCESFGHGTNACCFNVFCSLCKSAHRRGSSTACRNTRWNPFDQNVYKHFKFIDSRNRQNGNNVYNFSGSNVIKRSNFAQKEGAGKVNYVSNASRESSRVSSRQSFRSNGGNRSPNQVANVNFIEQNDFKDVLNLGLCPAEAEFNMDDHENSVNLDVNNGLYNVFNGPKFDRKRNKNRFSYHFNDCKKRGYNVSSQFFDARNKNSGSHRQKRSSFENFNGSFFTNGERRNSDNGNFFCKYRRNYGNDSCANTYFSKKRSSQNFWKSGGVDQGFAIPPTLNRERS